MIALNLNNIKPIIFLEVFNLVATCDPVENF